MRTRWRTAATTTLLLTALGTGLVSGCTGPGTGSGTASDTETSTTTPDESGTGTGSGGAGPGTTDAGDEASTAPQPPSAPADDGPPDAERVRRDGTTLTVGDVTVVVLPLDGTAPVPDPQLDGSVRVVVHGGAYLAGPVGTTAAPLSDTSAVLRDADGRFVVGFAPVSPARFSAPTPDVLALTADGDVTLSVATATIAGTAWGEREGGRSLAVTPTAWARTAGLAAQEGLWTQLVAREPEADTPSMHDQLLCHELGAPDKDRWNLEPWRPQVDALTMLSSRCNPT